MRLLSTVSVVLAILGGVAGSARAAPATPWLFVPAGSPSVAADTVLRALEQAAGEGAMRNVSGARKLDLEQSREPDEIADDELVRAKTLAAMPPGAPATAWEIGQAMWAGRPGAFPYMVVTATLASLDLLEHEGRVERVDDGDVVRYRASC